MINLRALVKKKCYNNFVRPITEILRFHKTDAPTRGVVENKEAAAARTKAEKIWDDSYQEASALTTKVFIAIDWEKTPESADDFDAEMLTADIARILSEERLAALHSGQASQISALVRILRAKTHPETSFPTEASQFSQSQASRDQYYENLQNAAKKIVQISNDYPKSEEQRGFFYRMELPVFFHIMNLARQGEIVKAT